MSQITCRLLPFTVPATPAVARVIMISGNPRKQAGGDVSTPLVPYGGAARCGALRRVAVALTYSPARFRIIKTAYSARVRLSAGRIANGINIRSADLRVVSGKACEKRSPKLSFFKLPCHNLDECPGHLTSSLLPPSTPPHTFPGKHADLSAQALNFVNLKGSHRSRFRNR